MDRFVVIGVDIAIIALIGISLLSNEPLIKKNQATALSLSPAATETVAEAKPH